MVDHSETGGAPLLGVNGVCIIAHGGSSPKAIKNAILRAKELVEKKMNGHIRDDIESNLMSGKEPFWKLAYFTLVFPMSIMKSIKRIYFSKIVIM